MYFVYVNLQVSQYVLKNLLAPFILRINPDTWSSVEDVCYTPGLFIVIFTSDVIELCRLYAIAWAKSVSTEHEWTTVCLPKSAGSIMVG